MATSAVLVIGGSGQLGVVVVSAYKAKGYAVTSVDNRANDEADVNILIDFSLSSSENLEAVSEAIVAAGTKFDTVVSAAGGWRGGSIADADVMSKTAIMISMCLESAIMTAHIAAHHLKENGILVLTGAQAAMGPTPGMIAYGVAKAGMVQLVSSLAAEGSGLPEGTIVAAVMPSTLDTEANRAGMPDADFSEWTPLGDVADLFVSWSSDPASRPENGALVNV